MGSRFVFLFCNFLESGGADDRPVCREGVGEEQPPGDRLAYRALTTVMTKRHIPYQPSECIISLLTREPRVVARFEEERDGGRGDSDCRRDLCDGRNGTPTPSLVQRKRKDASRKQPCKYLYFSSLLPFGGPRGLLKGNAISRVAPSQSFPRARRHFFGMDFSFRGSIGSGYTGQISGYTPKFSVHPPSWASLAGEAL